MTFFVFVAIREAQGLPFAPLQEPIPARLATTLILVLGRDCCQVHQDGDFIAAVKFRAIDAGLPDLWADGPPINLLKAKPNKEIGAEG
jgi:hypothetical protein